jgi:hypothetical protein
MHGRVLELEKDPPAINWREEAQPNGLDFDHWCDHSPASYFGEMDSQ